MIGLPLVGLFFRKYGLYLALGLAVVGLGLAIYLGGRSAGKAAAVVDTLRESIKRTEKAQRARAAVKPEDREAMKNDPFNRNPDGM